MNTPKPKKSNAVFKHLLWGFLGLFAIICIAVLAVLNNATFQTFVIKRIVAAANLKYGYNISFDEVHVQFNKTLSVKNIVLCDKNRDTILQADITCKIQNWNFKNKTLSLSYITCDTKQMHVLAYEDGTYNFDIYLPHSKPHEKSWTIQCNAFDLKLQNFDVVKQLQTSPQTTKVVYKSKQLKCSGRFQSSNDFNLQLHTLNLQGSNYVDFSNVNGQFIFSTKGIACRHAQIKTRYSQINTDSAFVGYNFDTVSSYLALQPNTNIDIFEVDSLLKLNTYSKHAKVQLEGKINYTASKIITQKLQAKLNASNIIKGDCEITLDTAFAFKKAEINHLVVKTEFDFFKNYISASIQTDIQEWIGHSYQFTGNLNVNKSQMNWDGTFKTNFLELQTRQHIKINDADSFLMDKGTIDIISYNNVNKGIFLSPSHIDVLNFKSDSAYYALELNGTLNAPKINTLQVQSINLESLRLNSNNIYVQGMIVDQNINSELLLDYNIKSSALVAKIDFNTLNLHSFLPETKNINCTGKISIDGVYKNINSYTLSIELSNLGILNPKQQHYYKQFLDVESNAHTLKLHLKEGMLNGTLDWEGKNLSEFITTFIRSVYAPENKLPEKTNSRSLIGSVKINNIDFLTHVIEPLNSLSLHSGSELNFKIEEGKVDNYINFNSTKIKYKAFDFNTIKLKLQSNFNALISVEVLNLPFNQSLNDLKIESHKNADKGFIAADFNQSFNDSLATGNLKSMVYFHDDQVNFNIETLSCILFNQFWDLKQSCNGWYNPYSFGLNDFCLESKKQVLTVNGQYGNQPNDSLQISIHDFELQNLNTYLKPYDVNLSGLLNSQISLYKRYNEPLANFNIACRDLNINATPLGELQCHLAYNTILNAYQGQGLCFKNQKHALLKFNALYTSGANPFPLSITYSVNNFPTTWLNPYFTDILHIYKSNINGVGTLKSNLDNIETWGEFDILPSLQNRISVDYTNVMYIPVSGKIILSPSTIKLEHMVFNDTVNTAKPCGTIDLITNHSDFTFNKINLNADFKNALLLNTSRIQNELYHGILFGTGNFKITGTLNRMNLIANIENDPQSQFIFNSDAYTSESDLSFISFKSNTVTVPKFKPSETVSFLMNLKVNKELANRFYIDQSKKDFIKFNGYGNLTLNYSHEGDFTMNGEYILEDGGYNYKIEEVIDKPFQLVRGSKMTWNGDPMNGILTATATNADYCSIAPLINDSTINSRVPTECQIILSGTMLKPDIRFKLEFKNINSNIKSMLDNIMSDETELNRQVFSYLMFKSFVKPQLYSNSGGGITAQNAAATSGSEFLSQRLNNMLNNSFGNVLKDLKLGVNYRPINQNGNKDAFDFSVNKNFFNNRLNIDGEFGYNRTDSRLSNSLIGDVNIEYRIHPEGNLKLKGFNRTNDITQITTTGGPYTQGIGLFYLKEIETRRKSKASKK